jgi:NAD dependent epimerase/dehydratase family enzyme
MIKLILGEFGSVLLKGQRVIPRRMLDAGFKFRYPNIEEALKSIILS